MDTEVNNERNGRMIHEYKHRQIQTQTQTHILTDGLQHEQSDGNVNARLSNYSR